MIRLVLAAQLKGREGLGGVTPFASPMRDDCWKRVGKLETVLESWKLCFQLFNAVFNLFNRFSMIIPLRVCALPVPWLRFRLRLPVSDLLLHAYLTTHAANS